MNFICNVVLRDDYRPEMVCDTSTMTDEEFTRARREMNGGEPQIGGSDAGIICGCESKYRCASMLWCELNNIPLPFKKDNVEVFKRGHRFEPYVVEMFDDFLAKKGYSNYEIIIDKHMYRDGRKDEEGYDLYPYCFVNLDAIVHFLDTDDYFIIECKTTHAENKYGWLKGEIDPVYETQCRYEMALMNVKGTFLVCAWGFDLSDLAVVFIERDYDKEAEIFSKIQHFCEYNVIEGNEPLEEEQPPLAYNRYKYYRYGKEAFDLSAGPKEIELTEDECDAAEMFVAIEQAMKTLDKQTKELKAKKAEAFKALIHYFSDTDTICASTYDGKKLKIEYKYGSTMTNPYDIDGLKAKYPDVYAKCCTAFDPESVPLEDKEKLAEFYRGKRINESAARKPKITAAS